MSRAFPFRPDCPNVPDTLALDLDLGIDCSTPPALEPHCEAAVVPPPAPIEPFGCPEPVVSADVAVIGSREPPRFDAAYVGGDGDNCSKELDLHLELPTFDCTTIVGANVSSNLTYGRPSLAVTSDRATAPDCDIDLDVAIDFPCTGIDVATTVTTGAARPDLRVTAAPRGGDACGIDLQFEIDFPALDFDFDGVCSLAIGSVSWGTAPDPASIPSLPYTAVQYSGQTGVGGDKVTATYLGGHLPAPDPDHPGSNLNAYYTVSVKTVTMAAGVTLVALQVRSDTDEQASSAPVVTASGGGVAVPLGQRGGTLYLAGGGVAGQSTNFSPGQSWSVRIYNTLPGAGAWLAAAHNPDRPCEMLLDLDIRFPHIDIDIGAAGHVYVDNNTETRFANVRSDAVTMSGSVSSSDGGGGSGGGSGGGVVVGGDSPCTDVKFKRWKPDASADSRGDPDFPDKESLWRIETEGDNAAGSSSGVDDVFPKVTQRLEYTFNRLSVLEISVCREIAITDVGEDCVTKWDFHGLVSGTALRMWKRALPPVSGWAEAATKDPPPAGTPMSLEERYGTGPLGDVGAGAYPPYDPWDTLRYPPVPDDTALTIDLLEDGTGGCDARNTYDTVQRYPVDFANKNMLGQLVLMQSDMLDFSDFDNTPSDSYGPEKNVGAGYRQMNLCVPLVRLIRENLVDGERTYYPDFAGDSGKVGYRSSAGQAWKPADAPLPRVELTGGAYVTMDAESLRNGRPLLDLRSDMELKMPAGFTGIVPFVEDFDIDDKTGKIYLRKRLVVFVDGVVADVVRRSDYRDNAQKYEDRLKLVNSDVRYHIKSNETTPNPEDEWGSEDRPFEFAREIPTMPCEDEEEDEE